LHSIKTVITFFVTFFSCLQFSLEASGDSIPKQITFVKTLGVDEGLSQGMVLSIMQDKEGFIWLGTKDGLNRYDGYDFRVFKKNGSRYSLQDNFVQDTEEDEQGNFWVMSLTKGLFLFNKRTERFYPVILPSFETQSNYSWYHIITQGQFLYVCNNAGIYVYSTAEIKPDRNENSKIRLRLCSRVDEICSYKLSLNKDGSFWFSKGSDSIHLYQTNSSRNQWWRKTFSMAQYRKQISLQPSDTAFDFVDQNRRFVFQKQRLRVYDYTSTQLIKEFTIPNGTNPDFQNYIAGTHELMFNYENIPGVFELNLNTMKWWHNPREAHGHINGHFHDRTNLIWVKTNGYGISLVTHEPVTFKQLFFSVRCKGVPNNIFYDKFKGGVYMYEREHHKSKQILSPNQYYPTGNFNYLILDKDSVLWLSHTGTNGCLYSYDLKTKKLQIIKDEKAGIFKFIFEGKMNQVWIYEEGINYSRIREFDKRSNQFLRHFDFPNKLSGENLMYDVHQAENDVYWIVSHHGLIRFSPDQQLPEPIFKFYNHDEKDSNSLSENRLLSVCPDPKNPNRYLWIGTEGQGLNRFDMTNGKSIHILSKDGLPNDVAYGILSDKLGHLWISTNMGLCCYSPPTSLKPKGSFRNFTKEDGLPGNEFNRYEYCYAPNGELEFSGVNGGVRFLPEQVLKVQEATPVFFISLYVNNELVEVGDRSGILKEAITYCKQIRLNSEQNIFTLKFASIDYRNTKGKKYQYYLEGFNKEWSPASERNEASYTNLNPGAYRFHLKGSNCDGVWNGEETILEIIILPAWYQTWGFKILCILLLLLAVYTLYRYKFQQLLKLQNLRNHIASDLHDELGSTLSSISLSTELIKDSIGEKVPEANGLLKQISTNVAEMMESMSDIVWTINTKNDSFKSIIRRMRSFAAEMLEPNEIEFLFHIQSGIEDTKLNMQQRKNIYLVFKESIHNIVKYSLAQEVRISLIKEQYDIVLSVEDNGIGFDTEASNNEFGGNGLYNIRKRAEELAGSVDIKSAKGEGTQVVLRFKLK